MESGLPLEIDIVQAEFGKGSGSASYRMILTFELESDLQDKAELGSLSGAEVDVGLEIEIIEAFDADSEETMEDVDERLIELDITSELYRNWDHLEHLDSSLQK